MTDRMDRIIATEDDALDAIVNLWHEAEEYDAEAEVLRSEAMNQQALASEASAKADVLIAHVVEARPEWLDDLRHERDPREERDGDD